LQRFDHLPDAVAQMRKDSGVSRRQSVSLSPASRASEQPLPVGDTKIAFTVKLSQALVGAFALSRTAQIVVERDRESGITCGFAAEEEGVARRPALDGHALQFEYRFDRLLPSKIEQAYEFLVPHLRRPIGSAELNPLQEIANEQTSCDLYTGFLGPSKGGHTIASQTAA